MIESLFPMIPISNLVSVMHQGINTAADKIEYSETGTPIIQSRNLTSGVLEFSDVKYLGEMDSIKYKSKYVPEVGDILFSNIGTVGKSIVLEESANFMFAWNVFLIRPNHEIIDKSYFKYYLDYLDRHNYYEQWFTGGTVKFLNKKTIGNFKIPLPPLAEQKRIAAILDKADAISRKRQQAIKLADEFLRSVFLDMFGELFNPVGYQDSITKTISELTTYIDYRGKTPEKSDSGIPLITAKNVRIGYVSDEPREFIPAENYDAWMSRGMPQENDVLFTTEAPLGNVALLGKYEKVAVGQRLIALRSKGEVTHEYLLFALLDPFVKELIDRKSSGSTVKGIRTKELYEIKLPVPNLKKQQMFSDIYKKCQNQKKSIESSLISTSELFNSLSQKAFSGSL